MPRKSAAKRKAEKPTLSAEVAVDWLQSAPCLPGCLTALNHALCTCGRLAALKDAETIDAEKAYDNGYNDGAGDAADIEELRERAGRVVEVFAHGPTEQLVGAMKKLRELV